MKHNINTLEVTVNDLSQTVNDLKKTLEKSTNFIQKLLIQKVHRIQIIIMYNESRPTLYCKKKNNGRACTDHCV